MKKILLIFFLSPALLIAQNFYRVQDSDGYVNARNEPDSKSIIVEKMRNNTIVKKDPAREVSKGWIPLLYLGNNGNPVYIFQDRLQPISKDIVEKLDQTLGNDYPYSSYRQIHQFSSQHPYIFMFYDGDCDMMIKDLKNDSILLSGGVPGCLTPIWDDTLSFYRLFNFGEPMLPAFVMYKFYQDKKGNYGFYTEITPEPKKIPIEKAKKNVQKIRESIKGKDDYIIYNWQDGLQIIEAYISGVDAMDILENSGCDASICHDIDNFLSFIEAYKLSKIKPQ